MVTPSYGRIATWARDYGSAGIPDQRALQDFIECETAEAVRMLQNELQTLATGDFDQDILDKIIGANRRMRYGSYDEWAKFMLMWIASYKG